MEIRATETVEPQPPDGDLEILPEGTLLSGRFELGRPLGWGGYAVVYEALDRDLHRRVAVKVLRGERVRPSTVARMRREVAVARDVTSPRLVKLYDITEDGPHTFITMELVEGRSLRDTLLGGPLPLDEALRIGDQILEALEILHASGIVHRDLKPANILLTPAGEVKIADFGLARHWANEEMHVTRTEGLVGTMEYLSPEQALGLDLDQRSDLYSFGVVLFEMLSGSLPFGGSSSLGTVVAHITTHAPDLRRTRAGLPLWLSLLVRRLLEKNRERRPASAAAVRNALERKTIDWSYRWKRSRAPVIALAALLISMFASGWFGWNHYWSRFDNISSDVNGTLRAYDRKGRALWSRPKAWTNTRAALLTLEPGDRRVAFMAVDDPSMPDAHETSRPLVLLDPQTGVETGRIELPPAPRVFPFQPRFDLVAIRPVDVDNDGADELVLSYAHYYWPSYSVLVNPRTRQAGFLLLASGHHVPIGAIDLDGDGAKELLFLGPNNRMGWRTGIAALHASLPNLPGTYAVPASTPDAVYLAATKALSWYTLLPRGRLPLLRLENVDEPARTFDLVADDGKRTTLTFDGFLSGSAPVESVESRQAARWESYSLLREAQMREVQHDFDGALALGNRAREAAVSAGETELEDWIASTLARTLARSSMPASEADAEIERILASTRGGSDLCWEVGSALSARAEPRRAANWFKRGLELVPSDWIGRPPPDYFTEAVVALVEIREWDEAIELVNRFLAGHPGNHLEALQVRSLVLWRTGRPVGETAPYSAASQWLHNYWVLEHVWSTGSVDPAEFLERLRRELRGSEHAPWIRSIEAEVLARLGRPDEALPIVRQARESVTADPTDATARIHRDVVEKRLEEIEAAARQHRP